MGRHDFSRRGILSKVVICPYEKMRVQSYLSLLPLQARHKRFLALPYRIKCRFIVLDLKKNVKN